MGEGEAEVEVDGEMVGEAVGVVVEAVEGAVGSSIEEARIFLQEQGMTENTDIGDPIQRGREVHLVQAIPDTPIAMCTLSLLGERDHAIGESRQVVLGAAIHISHDEQKGIRMDREDGVGVMADDLFGSPAFPVRSLFATAHGGEVTLVDMERIAGREASGSIEDIARRFASQGHGKRCGVDRIEEQGVVEERHIDTAPVGSLEMEEAVMEVAQTAAKEPKAGGILHLGESDDGRLVLSAQDRDNAGYLLRLTTIAGLVPIILPIGQEIVVRMERVVGSVEEVLHIVRRHAQAEIRSRSEAGEGEEQYKECDASHQDSIAKAVRSARRRASISSRVL